MIARPAALPINVLTPAAPETPSPVRAAAIPVPISGAAKPAVNPITAPPAFFQN